VARGSCSVAVGSRSCRRCRRRIRPVRAPAQRDGHFGDCSGASRGHAQCGTAERCSYQRRLGWRFLQALTESGCATDQWSDPNGKHDDHYALACECGFLGTMALYDEPVIVLGGEPGDLRYASAPEGHIFWTWIFGETEAEVKQVALEAFSHGEWTESGRYLAIDAAVPGADVTECLDVHFEPGEWDVGFSYVQSGDAAAEVYGFRHVATRS